MDILTNIVAADEDEFAAIGESLHPVDEWSGIERRGIDTAKIATLHCLLTGDEFGQALSLLSFLNTLSALLAPSKYEVYPVLLALRKYSTNDVDPDAALKGELKPFYKGQFIASVESGITSFADLKGKNFCWWTRTRPPATSCRASSSRPTGLTRMWILPRP